MSDTQWDSQDIRCMHTTRYMQGDGCMCYFLFVQYHNTIHKLSVHSLAGASVLYVVQYRDDGDRPESRSTADCNKLWVASGAILLTGRAIGCIINLGIIRKLHSGRY